MRAMLAWCVATAIAAIATPANAAWHEARSKHFIIYADQNPGELKAFGEKLERFDRAVRYLRGMEDPEPTEHQKIRIFLLRSEDDLSRLVGSQYIAGLYKSDASGSYAFLYQMKKAVMVFGMSGGTGTYDNSRMNTQIVFFHEYAHHLQLQDWAGAMPAWVSEGFAEFFATADIDRDGNVTIGKFPSYRSWEVTLGGGLSAEELVAADYEKLNFYEIAALYGRAWLLTHYLTVSGQRKGQLNHYLADIEHGMSPKTAGQAAFGDLKALSKEVNAYAAPRSYLAITIDAKMIPIGNVAVRALSPAESAMVPVLVRQKYGVTEKTAGDVASAARKAAAPYPNDAAVQGTLAEAEYDAKNYAAAEAAAGRALAAEPNNVHALLYKGRAQVELAKANPQTANWDSIRDSFLKANKLDTENAEPLAQYYNSFAAAGQRPTKNALDALLYAVELAPQDWELRLTGVRALVVENKLADARELFAPIAYQPHLKKEIRELATKAMAAIGTGDAKTAVSLLDRTSETIKKEREKD